jgi:NADP-dependent 3-hydroxy acid dehydrogenase YdfG
MYSATKFAVRALTEALRQELRELGSKIRVSSISPGFVETEFAENYHKDPAAKARSYGKFQVLDADDIAWLVHSLISAPQHVQIHDVLLRPTEQVS